MSARKIFSEVGKLGGLGRPSPSGVLKRTPDERLGKASRWWRRFRK